MLVCEILPFELCQLVWKWLPMRVRMTATKASYEEHYRLLVPSIPRIGDYVIRLLRDSSTSYIFDMILGIKQNEWASLGRWKQWNGKYAGTYDDYFAFLRHVCRENRNHKCLLSLQELELTPSGGRKSKARNRPKHTKNKREEW